MEDQIKELIAKGIKLEYREIYSHRATYNKYHSNNKFVTDIILRWGDANHYIECKITADEKQNANPIFREEIDEVKNSVEAIIEAIIEASMKELRGIHQKQVDDNFKAFNEILPTILDAKRNQYALMKDCEIIEYFSTFKDADKAGKLLYPDHVFSVQKVTDEVINLGTFSL